MRYTDSTQARVYHSAIALVRSSGARVVHPVYITPAEQCPVDGGTNVGDLMNDIIRNQMRAGCESYLRTLDKSSMRTLADMIAFNDANADKEFDDGEYSYSHMDNC